MEQTVVFWIVVGILGGYLGSTFGPEGGPGGLLVDLIVGVGGSFAGGWVLRTYAAQLNTGWIPSAIAGAVGAFALVCVVRMILKRFAT